MKRPVILAAGLILSWQLLIVLSGVPPFIVPPPLAVFERLFTSATLLLEHALVTLIEILAGFFIGMLAGVTSAIVMSQSPLIRRWSMPVLVISQALPVFALAPVLVLWLGYGMASKIAMAVLIIYFPVTAAFMDGLSRISPATGELMSILRADRFSVLFRVQIPLAMPALATGLKIAAVSAPIGAVVGEWVGASKGLGYLMLHANARLEIDLVFAALSVLALLALTLFHLVAYAAQKITKYFDPEGKRT